ncbi:hypothetical protein [Streptomyces sp. ITFR-16]|uniref:hypothetical protein n=1 Tax=Streptomyces sp. ITFR-16 TaxID=3075198 RepID=UPI00288C4BFD|nr:hypothetical protein [Streptomyces sp. ITFR-16]WNI20782.1 hypothetical protein RLT58_02105 [Streptomyces sp. ITFR-16]
MTNWTWPADRGPGGSGTGLTRLVPVAWDERGARVLDGHRAVFLRGAAVGDALAVITPDRRDGRPAPVILLPG